MTIKIPLIKKLRKIFHIEKMTKKIRIGKYIKMNMLKIMNKKK